MNIPSGDTGDRGATMVEYSLVVALIVLVAVVGVGVFGTAVAGMFDISW